ncbi:MAG TPA: hypothetical protein VM285_05435, partial [Polyangia bacterium]|nr:hypothetical protein [Polyangia bacterium]
MAEMKHGTVSLTIADHIQLPPEAGDLTAKDLARIEKARRGVGVTAQLTAEAARKHPQILPDDVTPDELEAQGRQADDIDLAISDVEALLGRLKQANVMIDGKANEMLRKVLAHVRSKEKFGASISS